MPQTDPNPSAEQDLLKATPDTLQWGPNTDAAGCFSSSWWRAQPSTTWSPKETQTPHQESGKGGSGLFLPHESSVEDAGKVENSRDPQPDAHWLWSRAPWAPFQARGLSDLREKVWSASGRAFAEWGRCQEQPRGATTGSKPVRAKPLRLAVLSWTAARGGATLSTGRGGGGSSVHGVHGLPGTLVQWLACVMSTQPPQACPPGFINNCPWPSQQLGKGFVPVCFRALPEGAAPWGTTELWPQAPTHSSLQQVTGCCFVSRDEFVSLPFVRR